MTDACGQIAVLDRLLSDRELLFSDEGSVPEKTQ